MSEDEAIDAFVALRYSETGGEPLPPARPHGSPAWEQAMPRYYGDIRPECITHRPLPPGIKRCALDANVILDAALIADGAGILALSELNRRDIKLVATARACEEALDRLREFRANLTPVDDILHRFLKEIEVVEADEVCVAGIADHDAHVAVLGLDHETCILSEDLPLIMALDAAAIHGRTLREVLYDLRQPQPGILTCFTGIGFGADGHVFIKANAHPDVLAKTREWNLFEVRGLGRLAYDSTNKAFCFFDNTDNPITQVNFQPDIDKQFAALVNYATGKTTTVTLKVCSTGSDDEVISTVEIPSFAVPPEPNVCWMNRYDKPEGWLGNVQVGTFGPYRLSSAVWRACRTLIGVSPPTLTADLALGAAILSAVEGDRMRRPLWEHVMTLAHISKGGFYPGSRRREREEKWFGESP